MQSVIPRQSQREAWEPRALQTLVDQISREFKVIDHGIGMEIEFNDDAHEATGAKLYLQLK